MTARVKIGVVFAAAAVALAGLVHGGGAARRRTVTATVEPASVAAMATLGGVVVEALARPGDRVVKGQPLVRFDAGGLAEQRRALVTALESARTMAAIPRSVGGVVVDAHPEVLAAEQRYTSALAAWEQAPEKGRAALDRAAAERVEARRRVGASLGKSTDELVAMLEARLADVDRALADREVRAPADGVVEILDLRAGDRIAPGGPAAVLTIPGEYVCEIAEDLRPGAVLRGATAEGVRVEARVETVVARPVPVALREDRRVAEERVARARFSSAARIPAGAAVRLDLP